MFTRRFRENLLVTLLIALLMSVLYVLGVARLLDARFSDLLFLPRAASENIVIVAIDDASITAVGQWPWARAAHAKLFETIAVGEPAMIGYDVNFPEPSARGVKDDAALTQVFAKNRVVLPVEYTLVKVDGKLVARDPVKPIFDGEMVQLGVTNTPPDPDGVVRSIPLVVTDAAGERHSSFSRLLAIAAGHYGNTDELRVPMRVNFAGPPGTFRRIPAKDVIDGKIKPDFWKGKIVLVGATAPDLHDEQIVPTSRGIPMPGVEIHANAVETLTTTGALQPLPKLYGIALIFLFALIVGILVTRGRLRNGTIALGVILVGYTIAVAAAFGANIILPYVFPVLATVVAFITLVAIRYVYEQRERVKLKALLEQYISPTVAADLLAHPEKLTLGGERREMTVLFSDLRGFTTLSESMTPDKLVTILNHYLDVMTGKVFETNGVVDKYMGDAIMAFWGTSFLEQDHADRALTAAILMRETLAYFNDRGEWPHGVKLALGIGVNTGEMIVGNMGSSRRFDYTVLGDSVNLASRLEGLNKEYGTQIITTAATKKRATPGKFIFRALDLVAVKGKKEPVEIFEVMGEGTGKEKLAKSFEIALAKYRAKQFAEAEHAFEEILREFPEDAPAKLFLERSREFLKTPPSEDWNGVWVYTKK